jgi:galactokinase
MRASELHLGDLLDPEGLRRRLRAGGLSSPGVERAVRTFLVSAQALKDRGFGLETPVVAYFVPGRIELLGKHTDYAGGRSLVAPVEYGFGLVALAGRPGEIRLVDASSRGELRLGFKAGAGWIPAEGGGISWARYPRVLADRLTADFPGWLGGGVVAFSNSLPSASGMSSSSALLIGLFQALAAATPLANQPSYRKVFEGQPETLAAYLGAVESGRPFPELSQEGEASGVGTEGGNQDHGAILLGSPGVVTGLAYGPLRVTGALPLPPGWTLAVGVSGVRAAKAEGAKEAYNRLSREARSAVELRPPGLAAGGSTLGAILEAHPDVPSWGPPALQARIGQFRAECFEIIPEVWEALARGDARGLSAPVARSQELAEKVLLNQTPETTGFVRLALGLGAAAASAFGAGFGGAVWALVPEAEAARFLSAWLGAYQARFPERRRGSRTFLTPPGPPAFRLE